MKTKLKVLLLALLTATFLLTTTNNAAADNYSTGYEANSNLMLGFGVGMGWANCTINGCPTKIGFNIDYNLGVFVDPRFAVMYDVSVWAGTGWGYSMHLVSNDIALQHWLTPISWVKAGIGLASVEIQDDHSVVMANYGRSITIATGIEVMQDRNFALDLSGRFSILSFEGVTFVTSGIVLGARMK